MGNGFICQGSIADSYGPVDTGLACGIGTSAFDVFDSARTNEVAMRVYNGDGNLVRRVRHDRADGEVGNQLNGATVPYAQTQNITDILAVPGDFSSATETMTGEIHFRLAHGAPLLIGAGRTVFAPDGTVEFQAGPSGFLDLLAGAPSAVEPLCVTLATS
jgi:hypothetical protein